MTDIKRAVLAAAFVALSVLQTAAPADQALDHIVAVVEDDVILRSELDREIEETRAQLRASGKPLPSADAVEREALESLISARVMASAAERSGVTVTDEEVDTAIAGIAERNGITVSQLKQVLASSGMSYTNFREKIRKQILEFNFQRQQIAGNIEVTDAEIDSFLAQNPVQSQGGRIVTQTSARHILIRTGERTSETDAKSRLAQLRERITGGEDFGTLARSNSDDTASALKGGDLGWINPGDTTPEFEQQLNQLPLNSVSAPFESAFGWHIVEVLGRREQNIADEARRSEAAAAIRERKAREAAELLSRRLRDEAYVDIRLGRQELSD